MSTEKNSLMVMSRAAEMLAEANTIQKVKEFKNLALTAADWAKRKGLGQEAVKHAQNYALLAEIKLGEMLKATEKAKGGRPKKPLPSGKGFSEPRSDGSGKGTFGGRGCPPKIGPSPELGPKNDKPTLRVTELAKLDEEVKNKEANDEDRGKD